MISLFPLRLIPNNTKIDFMGIRKITFLVSIILTLLSLILPFSKGMNFGIDFTGGIIVEVQMQSSPNEKLLHEIINDLGLGEVKIQNFNNNQIMIRIGQNGSYNGENIEKLKQTIAAQYPDKLEFRKIDYVGPQIGNELIKQCFIAVILSFFAIMIYVAIRFEWQFGVGIIIALIHDAILTLGFMSIANVEVDLTSIAAILTIIGYSVNDSVVIYDRIRENLKKYTKISISEIISLSINETLSRTILTVMTTIIAVLSLVLFGGKALFGFSITVLVGIIIGTFSSIYISAPILIYLGINKSFKS